MTWKYSNKLLLLLLFYLYCLLNFQLTHNSSCVSHEQILTVKVNLKLSLRPAAVWKETHGYILVRKWLN